MMSGTQGVLCRWASVHIQRSTMWRAMYSTRSLPVVASAARSHLPGKHMLLMNMFRRAVVHCRKLTKAATAGRIHGQHFVLQFAM